MKKVLSAATALILLTVSLSLCSTAFAKENSLCFAVASDLHYNEPREELEIYDDSDAIFGYANRRAAMEDESGFIIDSFLNECAENDGIEFVLISGDICDNGRWRGDVDHPAVAEKFRKFERETGKKIFVTNGNHDTGAGENDYTNEDFRRDYYEFGFDEAIAEMDGNLSYVAELDSKYRLIVCDSCDPHSSTEDGLTADRVNWVCKMAKQAVSDGKYPVLMMHHNFVDHMPVQRLLSHNFIVRNHTLTAARFANAGIRLAFTGHEHGNDVASYTSLAGNKIYDFSTTSLTMYPLSYRIMTLTDDNIEYKSKTVEKIDTSALTEATKGYTEKQTAFMNTDLNEYSKQFLKQGIKYRLKLGFTMEKMGVKEGSVFYPLVSSAVGRLVEILEMPLYGEESVSSLASEYNIALPQSEYENGWDVVTELMAAHYAGDEPFATDSPEVQLILKTGVLILHDDLSNVNDNVLFGAANEILKNFGMGDCFTKVTKLCAGVFGPYTAGECFIAAVASPIVYGFCLDGSAPDNNGVIEGYLGNANTANVKARIKNFFEKIMIYTKLFLGYLSKVFVR
ncbi:MAG: metallophosphoesterase [Clostridiales bacterium]|nr:metallophosphoesterase [Clostridiales bacterium]